MPAPPDTGLPGLSTSERPALAWALSTDFLTAHHSHTSWNLSSAKQVTLNDTQMANFSDYRSPAWLKFGYYFIAIALNLTTVIVAQKKLLTKKGFKIYMQHMCFTHIAFILLHLLMVDVIKFERVIESQECYIYFYFVVFLYYLITFQVTFLSVDRWAAVHLKLRYQKMSSPRVAVMLVGIIWILSTVATLCTLIGAFRPGRACLFHYILDIRGFMVIAIVILSCILVTVITSTSVAKALRVKVTRVAPTTVNTTENKLKVPHLAKAATDVRTSRVHFMTLTGIMSNCCGRICQRKAARPVNHLSRRRLSVIKESSISSINRVPDIPNGRKIQENGVGADSFSRRDTDRVHRGSQTTVRNKTSSWTAGEGKGGIYLHETPDHSELNTTVVDIHKRHWELHESCDSVISLSSSCYSELASSPLDQTTFTRYSHQTSKSKQLNLAADKQTLSIIEFPSRHVGSTKTSLPVANRSPRSSRSPQSSRSILKVRQSAVSDHFHSSRCFSRSESTTRLPATHSSHFHRPHERYSPQHSPLHKPLSSHQDFGNVPETAMPSKSQTAGYKEKFQSISDSLRRIHLSTRPVFCVAADGPAEDFPACSCMSIPQDNIPVEDVMLTSSSHSHPPGKDGLGLQTLSVTLTTLGSPVESHSSLSGKPRLSDSVISPRAINIIPDVRDLCSENTIHSYEIPPLSTGFTPAPDRNPVTEQMGEVKGYPTLPISLSSNTHRQIRDTSVTCNRDDRSQVRDTSVTCNRDDRSQVRDTSVTCNRDDRSQVRDTSVTCNRDDCSQVRDTSVTCNRDDCSQVRDTSVTCNRDDRSQVRDTSVTCNRDDRSQVRDTSVTCNRDDCSQVRDTSVTCNRDDRSQVRDTSVTCNRDDCSQVRDTSVTCNRDYRSQVRDTSVTCNRDHPSQARDTSVTRNRDHRSQPSTLRPRSNRITPLMAASSSPAGTGRHSVMDPVRQRLYLITVLIAIWHCLAYLPVAVYFLFLGISLLSMGGDSMGFHSFNLDSSSVFFIIGPIISSVINPIVYCWRIMKISCCSRTCCRAH